jgi:uncharacterized protein (TIGR00730 family)
MANASSESNDGKPGAAAVLGELDGLITRVGGDCQTARAQRVRELLHTSLKLIDDGSDLGEVKLMSRSLKELRYALSVFRPYADTRKVSIFGSARTPEDHPDYLAAVDFAQRMADAGWMVITGAGDGIMRAGHDGARRESSFGVSIRLPFETNANDIIQGDDKLVTFRYFFTRKLVFMWMSSAVVLLPGGFGTQDEGFEALTLVQTGKAPMTPIVMIDPPADASGGGGDYWARWDEYIRTQLLDRGWISPEDTSLYHVTTDIGDAVDHVIRFYRNYHSERFVHERHVLRTQRPLTGDQIADLNNRFAKLIKTGRIEQSGPLDAERGELPHLQRIHWHSHKRSYGTLRQLIDAINDFDVQNHPDLPAAQTDPAHDSPPRRKLDALTRSLSPAARK